VCFWEYHLYAVPEVEAPMSIPTNGHQNRHGFDGSVARRIIEAELWREGPLLPILHSLQEAFGCIPQEAEPLIASILNITRAEVHGVVSFYHDFRREPAGRHVLKLCRAEACQSMGAEANSRRLLGALGLDWGGTTPDGSITVEPVYCLGLCATAPSAMLDGEPHGRLSAARLDALVAGLTTEAKR
jgi:formate dehydrogenase subunit gamma